MWLEHHQEGGMWLLKEAQVLLVEENSLEFGAGRAKVYQKKGGGLGNKIKRSNGWVERWFSNNIEIHASKSSILLSNVSLG